MKPLEKINLIKNIIFKINEDFKNNEEEIASYLKLYNIDIMWGESWNGNYSDLNIYQTLCNSNNNVLKSIAEELEISPNLSKLIKQYPENWKESENLKLFISHSSKNKVSAINLKNNLINHKIDAFVAHEDIKTSLHWREQIKLALNTMDLFLSINTKDFNDSHFCQQELGFAISRNVDIIQLRFDKKIESKPLGLGEEIQAYSPKNLEDTVNKIVEIARNSSKIGQIYNNLNPVLETNNDDEIPF
jgi:hypothetical protein